MTEIKDVKIYELNESIVASGLAMKTEAYDYSEEISDPVKFQKHLDRCKRLVQASKNSKIHCHDNFLTGIRVSFDIKYPQYLSPEMQRYHFFDIVTSMSKMHRLLLMNPDTSCNKYVTTECKDLLKSHIENYNILASNSTATADDIYKAWMTVLSNTPLGLELWMRVSTNYKQLQTIYCQRKNHRLKEDWGAICKFIEELPYAKELIIGE